MILDRVKGTIKKYRLIKRNDRIVIGVSGGPDSVALLYLLNTLKKELKLALCIAHLDHMLRKDSSRDRAAVERLGAKLDVPVTAARVNVRGLTDRGSLEEIARNARFKFFFGVARRFKADKIALGHNLDDQAETVLMRILRGSGLCGLAGILPKREILGYQVIRPLIEVRRREINGFLKQKRIKPCTDISNSQDIYSRNKIRNRLLPLLERDFNKNIKEGLSNLAESSGYDYDYLEQAALAQLKRMNYRLGLDKLKGLHPAIRRLIFRLNIARIKGNTRRITFQHSIEIEDLLFNRPVNSIVDLPGGISVRKKSASLVFYKR